MTEPPITAVQRGDVVAVRDAFSEWHPAIAESGVIRRGVSFPLVRCSLPLRDYAVLPFPVEDVLLLGDTALPRGRTLRQAVDELAQPGAVLREPLRALRRGERVLVTAVLERTAVYEPGSAQQRELDRLEAFEMASFGKGARAGGRLPGGPTGP